MKNDQTANFDLCYTCISFNKFSEISILTLWGFPDLNGPLEHLCFASVLMSQCQKEILKLK